MTAAPPGSGEAIKQIARTLAREYLDVEAAEHHLQADDDEEVAYGEEPVTYTPLPLVLPSTKSAPNDGSGPSSTRQTSQKRSWVWQYFEPVNGMRLSKVRCTICESKGETFTANRHGGSTRDMGRHLASAHSLYPPGKKIDHA